MKFLGIALSVFSIVILIVSLVYFITSSRSRERIALLEKGHDPREFMKDRYFLNAIKAGIAFIGVGLGFLTAVILDEFVLTTIDNPGIYAGSVLISTGLALVIFYKSFEKEES